MIVGAAVVELHVHGSRSLKQKRGVVRSISQRLRNRFNVSVAEIGGQDTWQRARLGFATVSASVRHAEEVVDAVERLVWSRSEVEVLSTERTWLEEDA